MIKLFDPHVTEEEVEAARKVILSKNWATGSGDGLVKEFEQKFNQYIGSDEVVAVNSGTAALHLSMMINNVQSKNIFVPSLSFVTTVHSISYTGAKPVFVDIKDDTLCIDPDDLEEKIQNYGGIIALPVHFGGMPCDLEKIKKICKNNGLLLIDDAAHMCGGEINGTKVGKIADLTCFSFHPVKNLAMPTGGAITINNQDAILMSNKLKSLRWCGIDNRKGIFYDVTSISPNYYMNEISASIGLVQLKKLDVLNNKRREIAKRYSNEIKLEPKMKYENDCVYHLYWILTDKREELIRFLNKNEIEVGAHYRPIHTMTVYNEYENIDLPVTNSISNRIVTLPIHPNLTDGEITHIIDVMNKFVS